MLQNNTQKIADYLIHRDIPAQAIGASVYIEEPLTMEQERQVDIALKAVTRLLKVKEISDGVEVGSIYIGDTQVDIADYKGKRHKKVDEKDSE